VGNDRQVQDRHVDGAMGTFETQLACSPTAPRLARAWVRPKLQGWNLDGLGEVIELLLSELVANVVQHVRKPMVVRLSRNEGVIRVEVDDASATAPVLEHPEPDDENGRGIFLIAALAARWGTHAHSGDTKTVWFEIDAQ
jgi:anti-sigma regulatory factor (Ser/Thr protein kinase)